MSAIEIKIGDLTYKGSVTTVDLENEFQYFIDLGESLKFTLHLNEDTAWKSNNPFIDQEMVNAVGNYIENMEDFEDVLTKLDILRN